MTSQPESLTTDAPQPVDETTDNDITMTSQTGVENAAASHLGSKTVQSLEKLVHFNMVNVYNFGESVGGLRKDVPEQMIIEETESSVKCLNGEVHQRPRYSFSEMFEFAVDQLGEPKNIQDVYQWFMKTFPYFKYTSYQAKWRAQVRYQLWRWRNTPKLKARKIESKGHWKKRKLDEYSKSNNFSDSQPHRNHLNKTRFGMSDSTVLGHALPRVTLDHSHHRETLGHPCPRVITAFSEIDTADNDSDLNISIDSSSSIFRGVFDSEIVLPTGANSVQNQVIPFAYNEDVSFMVGMNGVHANAVVSGEWTDELTPAVVKTPTNYIHTSKSEINPTRLAVNKNNETLAPRILEGNCIRQELQPSMKKKQDYNTSSVSTEFISQQHLEFVGREMPTTTLAWSVHKQYSRETSAHISSVSNRAQRIDSCVNNRQPFLTDVTKSVTSLHGIDNGHISLRGTICSGTFQNPEYFDERTSRNTTGHKIVKLSHGSYPDRISGNPHAVTNKCYCDGTVQEQNNLNCYTTYTNLPTHVQPDGGIVEHTLPFVDQNIDAPFKSNSAPEYESPGSFFRLLDNLETPVISSPSKYQQKIVGRLGNGIIDSDENFIHNNVFSKGKHIDRMKSTNADERFGSVVTKKKLLVANRENNSAVFKHKNLNSCRLQCGNGSSRLDVPDNGASKRIPSRNEPCPIIESEIEPKEVHVVIYRHPET